jgi:ABC-type nickel/cobalt efflux system permease component RcnA
MTMDETTNPVMPQTLMEAHEALARIRPGRQAPLVEWLAYYQRAAALYAEVAEIDRGHHHESLYWAGHERQHAKEIKTRIHTSDDR